jgi:hypothetical protein
MSGPLLAIYSECHGLLDALAMASNLILLQPETSDMVASELLMPRAKRLRALLDDHRQDLITALGFDEPTRMFTESGATAPHALLSFTEKVIKLAVFRDMATVRREGLKPIDFGMGDARARLLIDEARLSSAKPPPLPQILRSTKEIAAELGVSYDRVRGWIKRKNDPLELAGKRLHTSLYDLEKARRILRGDPPKD